MNLKPSPPDSGDQFDANAASTTLPDDSILLMHFLDSVFPLQYPMYKPEISEGERGWLLSLLLRAKSFYHAALTTECVPPQVGRSCESRPLTPRHRFGSARNSF